MTAAATSSCKAQKLSTTKKHDAAHEQAHSPVHRFLRSRARALASQLPSPSKKGCRRSSCRSSAPAVQRQIRSRVWWSMKARPGHHHLWLQHWQPPQQPGGTFECTAAVPEASAASHQSNPARAALSQPRLTGDAIPGQIQHAIIFAEGMRQKGLYINGEEKVSKDPRPENKPTELLQLPRAPLQH